MAASLAAGIASWWGGDRLTLGLPEAQAPISAVRVTSPAAGDAAPGTGTGSFPLVLGQAVAFLPPLDPATTLATVEVDSAAPPQTLTVPVFAPLYGSYTFALRGYLPVTWDVGPRAMADVPPAGETSPSTLAGLTSAIAEGFNLLGGTPLTRLTADVGVGASSLAVERAAGLPSAGRAQVDGVAYSYAALAAGPASPSLSGIAVPRGGQTVAGAQAFHAAGAQVAFVQSPTSDLVVLRNALFLDTAVGSDLTALGRNLGVSHSPAIASDDQYRAVVKAVAYGPKTSLYGIKLALDALLGPGTYSLREDPIGAPCRVFITADYASQADTTLEGKSYIQDVTVLPVNADKTLTLPYPVAGIGPVYTVNFGEVSRTSDSNRLTGTADLATDTAPLAVAGASVPCPLVRPQGPVTPIAADVGSILDLAGPVPGRYRVAEVRGNAWAVHQGLWDKVPLAAAGGGNLTATVPFLDGEHPEQVGPFVYPRDLGRTVAVAGKTGTVAAILDPTTKADLATYATPLTQRSNVAVLAGLGLAPMAQATLALVPSFTAGTIGTYALPGAWMSSGGPTPTLTRRGTPPSASTWAVGASTIGSAQVAPGSSVDTIVSPEGVFSRHPLYIDAPFAVLEAYLDDLTAAGVRPTVEFA